MRGACGKSTGECEKVLVITAQEFDEVLAAGEDDVTERGRVPGGPIITIDEPADSDVLPPVRVDMRFLPPTGSTIDLDTLRVRWSFIDVTSRVTENLNVSPGGVTGLPSPVNTSSRFAYRTIKVAAEKRVSSFGS